MVRGLVIGSGLAPEDGPPWAIKWLTWANPDFTWRIDL